MDFALVTQGDLTQSVVPREALSFIEDGNASIFGHQIKIEGYNKNYGVLFDIATCQNRRRLQVVLERNTSKTKTNAKKRISERKYEMVPRQLFNNESVNEKKMSTPLSPSIDPEIIPDESPKAPSSSCSLPSTVPTLIRTIYSPDPGSVSIPETIVEDEENFSYLVPLLTLKCFQMKH
ncbi:hypothetical protein JTB14_034607 [Gonioctena quinquepunctata]|nr:hypothetical protein JTB14_034607 [Gonioctena quinquepunctata]